MRNMRKKVFTLHDEQGYIALSNEYEQHSCVSFDRVKKETTVIYGGNQKTYPLGDLLIDFITLDEQMLAQFDEDRRELTKNIHFVNASDFDWDFQNEINIYTENYIAGHNISKDDFAKKLAILDLIERYEQLYPYLSMLDFYTTILPCDNDVLLNEVLDLKGLQQKAIQLAEFCLDAENKELKKLPAEKRYYLYCASGRGSIPQGFKTRVVTCPNKIKLNDYRIFYKPVPKGFKAHTLQELTSVHDIKTPQDITPKTSDYLKNADIKLYEAYEISSVADMIYLELYQMILCNSTIKKCALCGKYFVMKGDYSTKYCNRKIRGKKQTCQQLGAAKDFYKRRSQSPPQVEYMKAYKRMYSRIGYGMITREKFTAWCEAAKGQMQLCEQGKISIDELKKFLGNK